MTVTPGPAPAPTGPARPAGAPTARRSRSWVWPAAVAAVVAAVALGTALFAPATRGGALDPRSAGESGSRAVAQILGAHGVQVDVVERSTTAVDGAADDATIVVVNPQLLGPDQLRRLADTHADLVLVEPDLPVLASLAPGVVPAGAVPPRQAGPGCADPDAAAAGEATAGGRLYQVDVRQVDVRAVGTVGCYPDGSRGFSVVRRAGSGGATGHRVTVLGQRAVLQNATLGVGGNAALALRTLGARPNLRWYLPDPLEATAGPRPTLGSLLPRWVRWVFWQVVLAVVVALVWRGRRLGRVVPEPLPVVVRSAETVEGRARLYRAGRARGRAAAVLRTAAVRRLAVRLGVPAGAEPHQVTQLVAAATGRSEAVVRDTLVGPPPRDDRQLVALASALDEIENSIAGASSRYGGATREPGGGRR
ncbi:MAG TPA: DUF4350 domain-containing protein [Kineosporiaceae bacterium]